MRRRLPPQPVLLAAYGLALLLSAEGPVAASEIETQSANVNSGAWAVRLTVTRACTPGDALIPDGAISGDPGVEPCGNLTANNVDVASGPVVFRAGESILLGEGFSVAAGAALTMEVGGAVLGDGYLRSESPDAEAEYVIRFYIDPDGLTLSPPSERFHHFIAYDAGGNREFLIGVTYNSVLPERRLFVTAFETAGTERTTKGLCELELGSGWQYIEAHWKASTGTDGDVQVSIDGGATQSLAQCLSLATGLDNSSGEISSVEWGARDLVGSSLGVLDMDDFESRSGGSIGPL